MTGSRRSRRSGGEPASEPADPARSPTPSISPTAAESAHESESPAASESAEPSDPVEPSPPLPLVHLSDGIPPVVATERDLVHAARIIGAGTGPVAVDAERASGFRYGQKAYLVQIRRAGSGTWLFDPVACPDLRPVGEAIGDTEWILHAATQDLPCLAGVGLAPTALFDTELGGRLAGLPRVGLGAMVEHYLGHRLAKEHSAADWSTRPLPLSWLEYAALDVEVLQALRDAVAADLTEQGKWEWARQEFEALVSFTGPPTRVDPWRRTSGMHKIRNRRAVAAVRELWLERDQIAQQRDVSPGRVLPDSVVIQLAVAGQTIFTGDAAPRAARRNQRNWLRALQRAARLAERELPPLTLPGSGPPPPRLWADRDPVAAARLAYTRRLLGAFAVAHGIPAENVISPDTLRRALWQPDWDPDGDGLDAALAALGARAWQRDVVVPMVLAAVADHPDHGHDSTI